MIPQGTPLLDVQDLHIRFGGVHALRGATFAVQPGTITALIGPNGAGKTTAFQCISGVLCPQSGRIRFNGTDVTAWRPDRITAQGLVRTFQLARGISRLSVLDNLLLYAQSQPGEHLVAAALGRGRTHEADARAQAHAIAARLNLAHVLHHPAAALSGGQKKLLELGRALMAAPRLILLDEPIAGVNPTLAETIADHLRALREEGTTFLIIEHHMDLIARLCDPVIVMAEGARLTQGPFAAIAASPAVQDAYMGARRCA